jgi:hypothetical protein
MGNTFGTGSRMTVNTASSTRGSNYWIQRQRERDAQQFWQQCWMDVVAVEDWVMELPGSSTYASPFNMQGCVFQ